MPVLDDFGPRDERPARDPIALADRALTLPHQDDDFQPCACDDCMAYGAEDAGFDWYSAPPATRIAMRVLDSGDVRLAAIAAAFRDHDGAAEARPCGHCGHMHFVGDTEAEVGSCGSCPCESWRPVRLPTEPEEADRGE